MFFIKNSIDSDIFNPVLAEVKKHPSISLFFANSFNSFSLGSSPKRSTLFSIKTQGILPPSENETSLSRNVFRLIILKNN